MARVGGHCPPPYESGGILCSDRGTHVMLFRQSYWKKLVRGAIICLSYSYKVIFTQTSQKCLYVKWAEGPRRSVILTVHLCAEIWCWSMNLSSCFVSECEIITKHRIESEILVTRQGWGCLTSFKSIEKTWDECKSQIN